MFLELFQIAFAILAACANGSPQFPEVDGTTAAGHAIANIVNQPTDVAVQAQIDAATRLRYFINLLK